MSGNSRLFLWIMHTCSRGRAMSNPPDISGAFPCISPNVFPHAFAIFCILWITGRLWITKLTGFLCRWAKSFAWPRIPYPWKCYFYIVKNCQWIKMTHQRPQWRHVLRTYSSKIRQFYLVGPYWTLHRDILFRHRLQLQLILFLKTKLIPVHWKSKSDGPQIGYNFFRNSNCDGLSHECLKRFYGLSEISLNNLLFHFSGCCSIQTWAVHATCVPSGFVKTRTSPWTAWSDWIHSRPLIILDACPLMKHAGFNAESIGWVFEWVLSWCEFHIKIYGFSYQ